MSSISSRQLFLAHVAQTSPAPIGLEIVKANSAVTFTRCSVRMRYTPGITSAGNRLVFDGTSYNIKSVLPTRSKGYMDLVCEAKSG